MWYTWSHHSELNMQIAVIETEAELLHQELQMQWAGVVAQLVRALVEHEALGLISTIT